MLKTIVLLEKLNSEQIEVSDDKIKGFDIGDSKKLTKISEKSKS